MKKAIDTLQKIQIAIGGVFLLIFLVTVVYQRWCIQRPTSPSPSSAIR